MADLSDVANALKSLALTALGTPSGGGTSTIVNANITIGNGWPLPATLDQIAATAGASIPQALISIYPVPNSYRNTSRYPARWKELSRPSATLTIVASGTTLTIGGTAPGLSGPAQNVAALVGFGSGIRAFVYQTTTTDTLDTIATNLAALINAATPASAAGAVVTISNSYSLVGRIGVTGIAIRELNRQAQMIDLHIWAPLPALRDQIGAPLRQALGEANVNGCLGWITLADGSAMRIRNGSDQWLDDPEKAGIYRRCIGTECDWATTETMAGAEIIVFESQSTAGGQTITLIN